MVFNGVVLIVLGIYGFIISGSPTALIAPAIGILLLAFSLKVRNGKLTAIKWGVVLTGIIALLLFVIGFIRSNTLVVIMAVVSLASVIFYITNISKKNSEE